MLDNLLRADISLNQLLAIAEEIKSSGEIAPDGCWIEETYKKNNARTKNEIPYYKYFKLVSKSAIFPKRGNGLSKTKHIGRWDEPKVDEVLASITRRDLLKNVNLRIAIMEEKMTRVQANETRPKFNSYDDLDSYDDLEETK